MDTVALECPTLAELGAARWKWFLSKWNGTSCFLADAPIPERVTQDPEWSFARSLSDTDEPIARLVTQVQDTARVHVEFGSVRANGRQAVFFDSGVPVGDQAGGWSGERLSVRAVFLQYCEATIGPGGSWWVTWCPTPLGDDRPVLVYVSCGEPRACVAAGAR